MEQFIKQGSSALWGQVALKVRNAVIFIDNHCAECLHWCGGGDVLFDAGANSIKEFSSFESGSPNENKVVFIISSPIIGKTAATVKDIIRSSHFKECVIITSLDARVHQYAAGMENPKEDDSFFQQLEDNLSTWMGAADSAAVVHLPIFMTPIFDNLFVTPAFDMLFPIQHRDLGELNLQGGERHPTSLDDLHFYMLPQDYRVLTRIVSSSFRSYFHILGCKEEIFALGATSRVLSVQLSNLSNHQKATYPHQIGVLFIDRTADLVGPVGHSEKSLLDQLLAVLPGLPGHYNNVSIDMSLLCSARCEEDDLVYSGCLVPDSEETSLLSDSYQVKSEDAVTQVTDKLLEAIADEGIDEETDIETDDANPAESIKNLVLAFKGNSGAILYNSSLLQFGLAISQMLKDPSCGTWGNLVAKEKLILQLMGEEDASSITEQILKFVESNQENLPNFEDVCGLLTYAAYAFKNHIETGAYDRLCECICNLISRTPFDELPENFVSTFDLTEPDLQNTGRLTGVVYRIMNTLSGMDMNKLRHYKILKFSDIEPPSYHPLLRQVMERIFDSSKQDLEPDIEHISTGRKDLLKLGMSMFRKITPPRPSDFQTLVVYVVGGITATEVAQMNKFLKGHHTSRNCKVIFGSNRLVSSADIVDKALFSNNLYPDVFG